MWVSGSTEPANPDLDELEVNLTSDRKDYKAGDTAEILVHAPFFPAEGVLTLRRSGILKVERFRMEKMTTTLRVQIEEGWTPNVHVQVDLLGEVEREPSGSVKAGVKPLPKKPAFARGL